MNQQFQFVNLNYLEEISGGDIAFKKELIGIFMNQIPGFISNLSSYLINHDYESLAKEAHTAKSSVLIFMMTETGIVLKQIQRLAEEKNPDEIAYLINKVESDLENAYRELSCYLLEAEEPGVTNIHQSVKH